MGAAGDVPKVGAGLRSRAWQKRKTTVRLCMHAKGNSHANWPCAGKNPWWALLVHASSCRRLSKMAMRWACRRKQASRPELGPEIERWAEFLWAVGRPTIPWAKLACFAKPSLGLAQ